MQARGGPANIDFGMEILIFIGPFSDWHKSGKIINEEEQMFMRLNV